MKQKLFQLLLNPFIIAGLISTLIIYFMPDYFSKYRIDLVKTELAANGQIVYYEDLDGDGKSEKIVAQQTQDQKIENASYLLYKSNGDFVDQFNLDKPFCNEHKVMWFKDVNGNGIKEIYIPTRSNDSAFLNVQEHLLNNSLHHKELFIDVMAPYDDEYEFRFHASIPFGDLKQNKSDLYFAATNGYSGNPRNIYKFDYIHNRLIKSPHLTNVVSISDVIDLDNDNQFEIITNTASSGNIIDTIYTKKSDYSTWLNVLDDDLDFLFEPTAFKCLGEIRLRATKFNDSINLIGFLRSSKINEIPCKLFKLNNLGEIEKEIIFSELKKIKLFPFDDNSFGTYDFINGLFTGYDLNLEKLAEYNIQSNLYLFHYDIDADNTKEWIGFDNHEKTISIFRTDFKDKVTINLGYEASYKYERMYGLKQLDSSHNLLYFQNKNEVSFFNYGENPNYYYGYLAYSGIYGIALGILLLAVKGQKIVETRKRAMEQEISKLQLKTIKNQVDPHFVFNAINTISEMTLTDNKLEADKFIGRFSVFMRETLKQSDKISTTLREELEYTENFIKLQQIRFNKSFDYQIDVEKGVIKSTIVPKHALFTYVENAIKHGIAYTKNGLLKISAIKKPDYLLLTIEDNGSGLQNTNKSKRNSTGRGLKIMDQIFELYSKLYKRKISHKLIELFDENKNKTGIRIEIKISNPKKQK